MIEIYILCGLLTTIFDCWLYSRRKKSGQKSEVTPADRFLIVVFLWPLAIIALLIGDSDVS